MRMWRHFVQEHSLSILIYPLNGKILIYKTTLAGYKSVAMKFLQATLVFAFLVHGSISVDAATCTGSTPCNACKNCSACKHCSKNGGSCGICQ